MNQNCLQQTPPEDPFFEGRKIPAPFSCIKAAVGLVEILSSRFQVFLKISIKAQSRFWQHHQAEPVLTWCYFRTEFSHATKVACAEVLKIALALYPTCQMTRCCCCC